MRHRFKSIAIPAFILSILLATMTGLGKETKPPATAIDLKVQLALIEKEVDESGAFRAN